MNSKNSLLMGAAALAASAVGLLLSRAAGARRLHHDVEQLFADATDVSHHVYRETQLVGLPAPVRHYFRLVLRDGQPYLRGLRLRHTGQFKTDLKKGWVPIAGEEYLTAEPPGLIWQGTTSQFTARDEYVDGRGHLGVRMLGAVPLPSGDGQAYDQGELLRWLAESAWLPTSLLPSDRVHWIDVDDYTARLVFAHHGQQASFLVRFNQQYEMEECETLRHHTDGPLLPWIGRYSRYRDWHGVRVPTVLEASWVVDGRRQSYAQFVVEELDYEHLQPY